MTRTILLYGLSLAALVFLLKVAEYRYFVRDLSLEFYLGLIAILSTAIGIWVGLRLTRKKQPQQPPEIFQRDAAALATAGISKREFEVLELMAQGHTNQEIADKLYVSLNTVKTHSANLFMKLDVSRRTQAVRKAKQLHLIP